MKKSIETLRSSVALAGCALLTACGGGGSSGNGFMLPAAANATTAPATTAPATASPADATNGPMVRQTAAGKIEGVDDSARSGAYFWKGVPYAQPPIGALRWRAPVEPEAWSGVRAADKFGHPCLQIGRLFGPGANNTYDETIGSTLNTPVGSEDCLTLNIWRPATTEARLPVLLFIHGGSNISGYTADPLYDGANLAKAANAVVVTANYRLGILGFLNIAQLRPGGGAADDSGNFALLDNMAALRFVQNNIEAFGGDPGNVTFSGESAGANNVLAVMTSPMAKGLFHRVIAMSGGVSLASNLPTGTLPTLYPATAAAAQGQAVLENLLVAAGKAPDLAAAATYARSQTPAQIAEFLRAQDGPAMLSTVLAKGLNSASPIPDGSVVPLDPIAAITAGNHVRVPTIVGNTRDEGKLFAGLLQLVGGSKPGFVMDDAARFTLMRNFDPDAPTTLTVADIVDSVYLPVTTPGTGYNARTQLITQGLFEANSQSLLAALKSQQSNVWRYRFDWAQSPAPWNDVHGAAHAFDLGFMFGNFGPSLLASVSYSKANRPGRIALSNAMMASIGAFMRNGDPNSAALGADWKPWPSKLLLDASPAAASITLQ
ncbi:carboxylesterase family protein [Variovorax sp. J22P168]|uniref:carboxylesterase/lipase family protein n=1 Tax=Variovorax jilinensis TaxID=3053513 RepID=UPI002574D1A5|nr:carboxylesterase family protein [Variovorax sp. J22P168]MDM0013236.1 carboxylesterase family protein [Variovorax sp. J22P168]